MNVADLPSIDEHMARRARDRREEEARPTEDDGPIYLKFGRPERGIMFNRGESHHAAGEYTLYGEA